MVTVPLLVVKVNWARTAAGSITAHSRQAIFKDCGAIITPVYPANRVLMQADSTNRDSRIRLFFQGQTIAADILSPPVLADGFRRIVQPIRISQQGDQFDGAEEFHRVGFLLAERPQFPRADENEPLPFSVALRTPTPLSSQTGWHLPTGWLTS